MSTDKDMVGGSVSDEVEEAQKRVHDSFENPMGLHSGLPADEIAAILQLDHELGLSREGDKVVIHPALGSMLFGTVSIVGPDELVALIAKLEHDDELSASDEETLERLCEDWFQVSFDLRDEESGQAFEYHPIVKGKTLSVRFLKQDEYEVGFMCASVREDGTLISVDKPKQTKF